MENIDINKIELKPKKKNFLQKLSGLFEDKNKRALYVILFILPFVIAIGIFGFIAFKEAKGILDLAKGTTEVNESYKISSMGYELRENATEYQQECFAELKNAIEVEGTDDKTIAGLVAKNFVADFYTWTNKQGQFDVGGLCYVCDSKTDTIEYKQNFYMKARDSFYKYLTNYLNQYGTKNLLEVQNVSVVSCNDLGYPYSLYELADAILLEDGDLERIYKNVDHDAYYVTLYWSYNPETKLELSKFNTSINLIVMKDSNGKFEIVEMSEKDIDARQLEDEEEIEEDDEIEFEED